MGTSKLCWLKKVRSGYAFREDFESDNFVNNDAWQLLQGLAITTDAQQSQGTYSLDLANSLDNSLMPVVIRQNISASAIYQDWIITVWYYDDATNTTNPGPYLKVNIGTAEYIQVGVRNAVSTGYYSCNASGSLAEDSFASTTAARTTGWHKLQVYGPTTGGHYVVYIDDVEVRDVTWIGATHSITSVSLQGGVLGVASPSFGYFDDLRVQYSKKAGFLNLNKRRLVVGSTSQDLVTDAAVFTPDIVPADNSYQIQISKASNLTSLDLNWYGQNVVGGDFYVYQEVDFLRKVFPFDYQPTSLATQNISPTGGRETIVTGRQDKPTFTIQDLVGDVWRQRFGDYFEYARLGNPFTVQTDSDETILTSVSALTTPSGGTNSVYVNSILGVTAAGIVQGGMYVLESADRSKRQTLTVSSVSSNHVFFNEYLNADFSAGDTIRSVRYWPLIMVSDPRTLGITYQNAKLKQQQVQFSLIEWVP